MREVKKSKQNCIGGRYAETGTSITGGNMEKGYTMIKKRLIETATIAVCCKMWKEGLLSTMIEEQKGESSILKKLFDRKELNSGTIVDEALVTADDKALKTARGESHTVLKDLEEGKAQGFTDYLMTYWKH